MTDRMHAERPTFAGHKRLTLLTFTFLCLVIMAYGINTGTIYNLIGKYKKAESSYRLVIDIASEFDIPLSLSDAKSGLGKSLLGQGRLFEAEQEVKASLDLALEIESLDKQLIAHKVAKDIHQKRKDLDKTVYHLEAIQMLNDSVFQIENAKQVDELQLSLIHN